MDQRWQMGGPAAAHLDTASIGQLYDTAVAHHQAGRLAEAENLYRRILEADPSHAGSLHLLGVVALQRGRPDAAIELIGKAIALDGENASFHNNIGEAYRFLARLDEAATHFARAISLEPAAAEGHMNLGNALKQQGKLDEAINAYRRAIELKPDYAEALMNLGVALMEQGRSEDAADYYRRALRLKPDFPEAHMNLGLALQNRGQLEEAAEEHRLALALRPNYAAAHLNLGNVLLDQGNLDEALHRYQQSLALMAGSATTPGEMAPLDGVRAAVNRSRAVFPPEERCFMNLVRVNCWRSAEKNWRGLCTAALEQQGLSPVARLELLARAAISEWIEGDRTGLAETLAQAAAVSTAIGATASKEVRNSRAYANYLGHLLRHVEQAGAAARDAAAPALAVIGDSHCLSYHGVATSLSGVPYVTGARLIMGCKAWHLANPRQNLYKWLLGAIIDQVPAGSPALCCFGEIDCRLDEGILPYYRKRGGDLQDLIADEVGRFVDHIAAAAAPRRLQLTFIGVPAPHLDALAAEHPDVPESDKALLIDVIKIFNLSLGRAAGKHGHRMVDVFALSAGPDGKASGTQHIDEYHLKPAALDLALR